MKLDNSSESAGRRRLLWPLLAVLTLLVLAACAPDRQGTINRFEARPLADGDASWRLEWEVTGTSDVSLNGAPIGGAARAGHDVRPTEPTTFTLAAGAETRSLTLAPVSSVTVAVEQDDLYVGRPITLISSVVAEGSDVEPGQGVSWSTSDAEVLMVTEDGTAEAIKAGTVIVTATSLQDSSVSGRLELQVRNPEPANISRFSFSSDSFDLAAGSAIVIEWNVTGASRVEITEVVTGDTDRTVHNDLDPESGMLELNLPRDKAEVNYRLTASNIVGDTVQQLLFSTGPQALRGWICADPEDVITFEDAHLEEAVWRIYRNTDLDPGDGILRCGMVQADWFTPVPEESDEYGLFEMHNAIVINRCDQDEDPTVDSLEGLQHLSTLLRLELMCNNVTDISQLAGLTSLQELNLDRNSVSDLTPLAGLTDLVVLGLYQNEVVDVSPLASLTELRLLYLSENRIRNVEPLADLVNLEQLWLYLNCETVIPGESWSGCLQDLSPLAGLHLLDGLVFHMNNVSDISFISSDMADLGLVFATGNRLTDISSLQELPALATVRLDDNLVSDISPLALNPNFPASDDPWYWERVDPGSEEFPENIVSMPPPSEGPFPGHLSLHYNCFDTESQQYIADLAAISDRIVNGAGIEGAAIAQMEKAACTGELGGLSVDRAAPPYEAAGLLRPDSRWYGNR